MKCPLCKKDGIYEQIFCDAAEPEGKDPGHIDVYITCIECDSTFCAYVYQKDMRIIRDATSAKAKNTPG